MNDAIIPGRHRDWGGSGWFNVQHPQGGVKLDGTTNDRPAWAALDAADGYDVPQGTSLISTSITIPVPLRFAPGSLIKPASGATVTLAGGVLAGAYKIFDLSAGGIVVVENNHDMRPQWWGAKHDGNDAADTTAAIQAMFDAHALTVKPGRMYFSAGEYAVTSVSLKLTRGLDVPTYICGDGPGASIIHASTGLALGTPVLEWKSATDEGVKGFFLKMIQISRTDAGKVFKYAMPTSNLVSERLEQGCIEDVLFRTGTGGSEDAVEIHGGLQYALNRVRFFGGNVALWIRDCSHMHLHSLFCPEQQLTSNIGLRISGGGNHLITAFRGEKLNDDNSQILIDNAALNILINGVWFEGQTCLDMINIFSGQRITIVNPALGPSIDGATGINIGAASRHIRVVGGQCLDMTTGGTKPNARAIRVHDDARHVTIEDFGIDQNALTNIDVTDPNTSWFKARIIEGSTSAGWTKPPILIGGNFVNTPAALATGNNNDYAPGEYEVLRLAAHASGSTLTGIAGGRAGRRLRIIQTAAANLSIPHEDANSAAANRVITPTGSNYTLAQNDIADLEYDATSSRWRVVNVLS